jgi:hypothetical protein
MIEKCSIGNMSYNLQNITLILLMLILIIVIIYYLKNSGAKHSEIIEKYTATNTNTAIDTSDTSIYQTHNSVATSVNNSQFPTAGTVVTLRDCQVQFNDDGTSKYEYKDGWQEIDTLQGLTDTSPIPIEKKIISRNNETNKDDKDSSGKGIFINYTEHSKCFKKMDGTTNTYKYQGNDLIKYDTGNHIELKVGANGVPKNYMEMKFNLDNSQEKINNYYTNLTNSICSLKYSDNLDGGNSGTGLGNLQLYRLTLNADNIITAINQITINNTNNHIFTVSPTTSFTDLLSSTDRNTSYVYSNGKFTFLSNSTLSVANNYINVKIYNFNRELLCSHIEKNIKSYTIIDNKQIDANKIVNVSSGNVSVPIDNTTFPGAASSYTTKVALKTAIENKIIDEIATANTSAILNEITANTNKTTYERERDTFLTSINTRDKFLDKIFDNTTIVSRKNFLVSTSGLINGLTLNKLGYKTDDVSSDETILNTSEEPSFSKIIDNTPANIYEIVEYKYNGSGDFTPYEVNFSENTECDILIVGGGGAGGKDIGAGGGGGAVLYGTKIDIPSGSYNIVVGRGATPGETRGASSSAFGATLLGGGCAGNIAWTNGVPTTANSGGSGSGGKSRNHRMPVNNNIAGNVGVSTKGTILSTATLYNGNVGGTGAEQFGGVQSAGGGGADAVGGNGNGSATKTGNGGNGVLVNITGANLYWGGGGGGGGYNSPPTDGGLGGGGAGERNDGNNVKTYGAVGGSSYNTPVLMNGGAGTGGGGGGSGYVSNDAGSGGSGIVILRYKKVPQLIGNEKQITLKYDDDNLFAWYNFDDNYNDVSGNGNNLTNHGTSIQTAQKIAGKAIEFDSTDYLEFPATMNPYTIWNGNGITFSFWVRFTAHSNWARLIDIQSGQYVYNGILISANSTHSSSGPALSFFCNGTVFYYSSEQHNIIKKLGDWYHIVFSIDKNGKWDIYLNNVRINNNEIAAVPNIPYNLRYINKSVYHWDGQWKGQMDDFRIYKTSFSASEVAQLYNKTRPLPSNIYRATLPIQTSVTLNGVARTLEAGIYNITMGPLNTVIKKHNTDVEIGTYTHTDSNKFIFKYATSRTLRQVHELNAPFSGTTDTPDATTDRKYLLGVKTLDMTTRYKVYIYHRPGIIHDIRLYANTILLRNGTDYIASSNVDTDVSNKIYRLTYEITIDKTVAGNIYFKSDQPIFYISETNRAIFNNTADTEFADEVNNLKASGSDTLTSLNDIFEVSTAITELDTAIGQKITYAIDTTPGIQSPLTIAKNNSRINITDENSLNNLKTTYNNIHNYNEASGGSLTAIINTNTFGSILNPATTNIEEYISYEFPSTPSANQLTPSSRTATFNIKNNATKYIYFRKI